MDLSIKAIPLHRTIEKLGKDELLHFHHPIENLKDLSFSKQISEMQKMIDAGAVHLKMNGHMVDDLKSSPFKHLDPQDQHALLYATFSSQGFDQTRTLPREASLDQMRQTLKKAIDITWFVPSDAEMFQRIAFGVKLTPSSPVNPQVIHVIGKKL